MAIRKLIRYPASSLRFHCREAQFPLSVGVLKHIGDLKDTLTATPSGLALASNQIAAEGTRVFVVRPGMAGPAVSVMGIESGIQPMPDVCINPRWSSYIPTDLEVAQARPLLAGHRGFVEGCLSVPELALPVFRPMWVELEYVDLDGIRCAITLQGLLARIAVHECDHLSGMLVIDQADKKTQVRVKQEAIKNRKRGR